MKHQVKLGDFSGVNDQMKYPFLSFTFHWHWMVGGLHPKVKCIYLLLFSLFLQSINPNVFQAAFCFCLKELGFYPSYCKFYSFLK